MADFNSEISIRDLISEIFKAKLIIGIFVASLSICAFMYARFIPDTYEAEALLVPVDQQSSGLSALLGGFDGVSTLVGLGNLNSGPKDKDIALQLLQSWDFVEAFIVKHGLAVDIYAVSHWDKESRTLAIDPKIYDTKRSAWVRDVPIGKSPEPTSWQVYKRFMEYLSVSENKKTGFITLALEYYSPDKAAEWLGMIISDLNEHLRLRKIKEARDNIEFLTENVEKTKVAEMKAVFFELMEEQTKVLMLAGAGNEYALKTVSAAKVPEVKSGPRRVVMTALGAVGGLFLGVGYTLFRVVIGRNRELR